MVVGGLVLGGVAISNVHAQLDTHHRYHAHQPRRQGAVEGPHALVAYYAAVAVDDALILEVVWGCMWCGGISLRGTMTIGTIATFQWCRCRFGFDARKT